MISTPVNPGSPAPKLQPEPASLMSHLRIIVTEAQEVRDKAERLLSLVVGPHPIAQADSELFSSDNLSDLSQVLTCALNGANAALGEALERLGE